MLEPLTFSPPVEELVRFVEDTEPEQIVAQTAARLDQGVPGIDLLRGAALAVSRSTEIPADHHGGPLHPVAGIHSVHQLSRRLEGKWSHVPVIQSVALANRHIHSPEMGPALMPALEPDPNVSADSATAREQLHRLIYDRRAIAAERYMIGLIEQGRIAYALCPMLDVAIPRNSLDDHYLLYLVHTLRCLDDLGWEWASTLLRLPLRYLATNPLMDEAGEFVAEYVAKNVKEYQAFDRVESLLEHYQLLERDLRIETGDDETESIESLGARLGAFDDPRQIGETLAGAMAEGLSLKGAGEALSYAVGLLTLRFSTANPMDVHLHTGLNPRRFLLARDDLPLRLRILLLLSLAHGPEVRLPFDRINAVEAFNDSVSQDLGQAELLAALRRAIETQPELDLDTLTIGVEEVATADELQEVLDLAYAYAQRGFDAELAFELFAELVSHEDITEMHAYKLQETAREEYYTTREGLRWVHLVSAARHLATVYNLSR